MDVKEPDLTGTYTYADYLTWTWDEMVELIDGKVLKMSPGPTRVHQQISFNLSGILYHYLRDKGCKAFSAPFDVRLPSTKNEKEATR